MTPPQSYASVSGDVKENRTIVYAVGATMMVLLMAVCLVIFLKTCFVCYKCKHSSDYPDKEEENASSGPVDGIRPSLLLHTQREIPEYNWHNDTDKTYNNNTHNDMGKTYINAYTHNGTGKIYNNAYTHDTGKTYNNNAYTHDTGKTYNNNAYTHDTGKTYNHSAYTYSSEPYYDARRHYDGAIIGRNINSSKPNSHSCPNETLENLKPVGGIGFDRKKQQLRRGLGCSVIGLEYHETACSETRHVGGRLVTRDRNNKAHTGSNHRQSSTKYLERKMTRTDGKRSALNQGSSGAPVSSKSTGSQNEDLTLLWKSYQFEEWFSRQYRQSRLNKENSKHQCKLCIASRQLDEREVVSSYGYW